VVLRPEELVDLLLSVVKGLILIVLDNDEVSEVKVADVVVVLVFVNVENGEFVVVVVLMVMEVLVVDVVVVDVKIRLCIV
jgi:hypothetical protein